MLFVAFIEGQAQQYSAIPPGLMLERLQPHTGKVSAVLDTDAYNEIDDQYALVYALLSPEHIDLQAIYAAPFRNKKTTPADNMEKSYDEIINVLKKLGRDHEGFVYRGSAGFMQARDQAVESEAARDLVKRAMAATDPLYVLTIGAPTNVASAILMQPEIIQKIVVVWLGGAGSQMPSASEYNLAQDLSASKVLFDSGVPLIHLPARPVTSHLLTTLPELETYLNGRGEIGDYLVKIAREYEGAPYAWSKIIWDISVVAYIVDPKWFWTEVRHTPILTDQVTYSFNNARHFHRVAIRLNRDAIFGDLFRKIENHHQSQRKK